VAGCPRPDCPGDEALHFGRQHDRGLRRLVPRRAGRIRVSRLLPRELPRKPRRRLGRVEGGAPVRLTLPRGQRGTCHVLRYIIAACFFATAWGEPRPGPGFRLWAGCPHPVLCSCRMPRGVRAPRLQKAKLEPGPLRAESAPPLASRPVNFRTRPHAAGSTCTVTSLIACGTEAVSASFTACAIA